MTSPDPVLEAKAYQDHLIGLVGDRDPAAVQGQTLEEIRILLADAGSDAATRPEPAEWSVLECLAHIVDAELVSAARYRWILAHDEPPLAGYDQDRWVDRLHHPVEGSDELMSVFAPLRHANLALWARTPVDNRDRVGLHQERGPESYGLTFTLIAGHDVFHLRQARKTLERIRDAAGRAPGTQ